MLKHSFQVSTDLLCVLSFSRPAFLYFCLISYCVCMHVYTHKYIHICVFYRYVYVCMQVSVYMYMGVRSQPQVCSLILLYYAFGDRVSASGVHRQVCTTAFGPSVGVSSPCLCSTFLLGHLPRPAITFDFVLVML